MELSVPAGALMLARAGAGDALSERILEAAKSFLVEDRSPSRTAPRGAPLQYIGDPQFRDMDPG